MAQRLLVLSGGEELLAEPDIRQAGVIRFHARCLARSRRQRTGPADRLWRTGPPREVRNFRGVMTPRKFPSTRSTGYSVVPPRSARDAVGVEDARDRADRLEHLVEVLGVGHLEGEAALGDPVAGRAQ